MNPVHDVVQIADQLAVGEVGLRVENEPVEAVLRQRKEGKAAQSSQDGIREAETLPGGQAIEHIAYHQEGEDGN